MVKYQLMIPVAVTNTDRFLRTSVYRGYPSVLIHTVTATKDIFLLAFERTESHFSAKETPMRPVLAKSAQSYVYNVTKYCHQHIPH